MGLLEEMDRMWGHGSGPAGHGGQIGGHVEETRKMVMQAVATAPDVRIALPKDGCESCGYTPADDWSHVAGYSNAPIERYPFIPCPDCVGGHPEHNQIIVRADASLVILALSALRAERKNALVDNEKAMERMGARFAMETNTYQWMFRRESVRIPIPADASECFRDYKPLTPDGERAMMARVKLEEMEVRFWVWRREKVGYSDFTIQTSNSAAIWKGILNSEDVAKDRLMDQYSLAAANAFDRQILDDMNKAMGLPDVRKIMDSYRKELYRSETSEEQRVRDAALREAVVKPDLAKIKGMAPKGKRSLAQSLRDDIKKAIKKADPQ